MERSSKWKSLLQLPSALKIHTHKHVVQVILAASNLNLNNNSINFPGIEKIADMLKVNTTIEMIGLRRSCSIDEAGAEKLLMRLKLIKL